MAYAVKRRYVSDDIERLYQAGMTGVLADLEPVVRERVSQEYPQYDDVEREEELSFILRASCEAAAREFEDLIKKDAGIRGRIALMRVNSDDDTILIDAADNERLDRECRESEQMDAGQLKEMARTGLKRLGMRLAIIAGVAVMVSIVAAIISAIAG